MFPCGVKARDAFMMRHMMRRDAPSADAPGNCPVPGAAHELAHSSAALWKFPYGIWAPISYRFLRLVPRQSVASRGNSRPSRSGLSYGTDEDIRYQSRRTWEMPVVKRPRCPGDSQ